MTTPTSTPSPPGPTDLAPAPAEEQDPVRLVARLFLLQLLAVLGVAAVLATVFTLTGRGTGTDAPAANDAARAASAAASPSGSTTAPASTAPAAPAPASTTAAGTPATSAAPELPKVDVLNQSAGNGAGSAAADQLRAAGWRIGRVDDFRGNISTTTIYFPPGLRKEARTLARAMPGSQRILPAFGTISSTRLSVILVG